MEVDRLRLAGTANGEVDRIAGSGVEPEIFKGIERTELDAVDADDLVTGAQPRLIGRTTVLNVVDGNAGG